MRLHLPFELLSDAGLSLGRILELPRFEAAGQAFYKRLTLIADSGRIIKTFYPGIPAG